MSGADKMTGGLDPEKIFRLSCVLDEEDRQLELWHSRRERIGYLKAMITILQNKLASLEVMK